MALILIRGENKPKILNAIADLERHAKLNLSSKPKNIDAEFTDYIVSKILKSELRTKSTISCAFFVKEDVTFSIMQIKKIHPPAHIVVVSDEYNEYRDLKEKMSHSNELKGYYSNKTKNTELKDYKSASYSKNNKK